MIRTRVADLRFSPALNRPLVAPNCGRALEVGRRRSLALVGELDSPTPPSVSTSEWWSHSSQHLSQSLPGSSCTTSMPRVFE